MIGSVYNISNILNSQSISRISFGNGEQLPDGVFEVPEGDGCYGGPMPEPGDGIIAFLEKQGISVIIDLTQPKYSQIYARQDGPKLQAIQRIIDRMKKAVEENERFYIHCTFGVDRTSFAVARYLMAKNIPEERALAMAEATTEAKFFHEFYELHNR